MPANRPAVFPRPMVLGIGGLLVVTVLAAATVREAGRPPVGGSTIAVRDLRFEDRADGAVLVYDGRAATPFRVLQGENGFLRGTMRGMARIRHLDGIDDATPFRLSAWQDGRLTLDDPATGRHVELEAFGPTNAESFAQFLPLPPPPGGHA